MRRRRMAIEATTGRLAVGSKVTVLATIQDPIQIELHPCVVVAEVVEVEGLPAYYVEHHDTFRPKRYGPFLQTRLRPGWWT